jgi:hypothetical protein
LDALLVQELEDANEVLREAKRLHFLDLLLETLFVELHCEELAFGSAFLMPISSPSVLVMYLVEMSA